MKVSKINKFFRKVGEAQIKHRKLCLIILFAVTLICLSGMRNFRSESSNSDWIVNGSEIKKNSDHFKEVFPHLKVFKKEGNIIKLILKKKE